MRTCLETYIPVHYRGFGWSSIGVELALEIPDPFESHVYIPQVAGRLPPDLRVSRPFPFPMPAWLAYRASIQKQARALNERKLLDRVRRRGRGTPVWLWPGASLDLQRELKRVGAVLIREMINTHQRTAKRILDEEHALLGLKPASEISEADCAAEDEELSLADYVVSPSESVDESLQENGVAGERLIQSSFGWSPRRWPDALTSTRSGRTGLTAIFVGRVGIRKGIHHALAAWDKAGLQGTLLVAGGVEESAIPIVRQYEGRSDIRFIPFTTDIGSLYRSADFMFFPTLEEGAPIVCYEAAAHGVPILTSPMGRARLVEHEVTGLVVDPHDETGLVDALQRLSNDDAFRQELGISIRQRARTMDFKGAAADRARSFVERGLA